MEYFHSLLHYDEVHINNNNFIHLYEITKHDKDKFKIFLNKLKSDELLTSLSISSNVFYHKNINQVINALSKNKNFKELNVSFNTSFKLRHIKSLNLLKNEYKNIYMRLYFLNKQNLKNQDLLLFLKSHLIDEIYVKYLDFQFLINSLIKNNNIINLYFFDEEFNIDYSLSKTLSTNTSIKRLDFSLIKNKEIGCLESLQQILSNNKSINILDLSNKEIDLFLIFDIMHNKNNITSLILDNCKIIDSIPFLQIIRENEQLISLSLVNNPIKDIDYLVDEVENHVNRDFELII